MPQYSISDVLKQIFAVLCVAGFLQGATAHATSNTPGHDVHGKYHDLIDQFGCPDDHARLGLFFDQGWTGSVTYCGFVRPAGYWVWYNGTWAVWRTSSGLFSGGSSTSVAGDRGHDVNGKYTDLIDHFGCAADVQQYGEFYDWGYWGGGNYCGAFRPAGYYVWYKGSWAVWRNSGALFSGGSSTSVAGDRGHDANGKYFDLIEQFGCASDIDQYGEYYDWGWWGGGPYCGGSRAAGYYVWYKGSWAVWAQKAN